VNDGQKKGGVWDERYEKSEYFYGLEPNDFLVASVPHLRRGAHVLCLGEGEGRNAVFLAEKGCTVTAVDWSAVGLQKLQALAARRSVAGQTVCSDLADFEFGENRWDGIVSIWCHLPSSMREKIHARSVAALKPGGVLILEAYTPKQLAYQTGGPKDADLLMKKGVLEREFAGLHFIELRELERDVHEGQGHQGHSAVVRLVAVKE
jgi:cyclopropane fatty-acyl-phospholipid synthase-like methyltransferase